MFTLLTLAPRPAAAQFSSPAAEDSRPFATAIASAQRRLVKVFGAEIGRNAGYASGVLVGPAGAYTMYPMRPKLGWRRAGSH
jgi:hypothetical protein